MNSVSKNFGILVFLVVIIVGGIGYAIQTAPELPEHRLFDLAIKHFAEKSSEVEKQFKTNQLIANFEQQLNIEYSDVNQVQTNILVKMSAADNQITLTFGEGNTAMANQSILLEPFFPRQSAANTPVHWKCIGGSVLIRFRSKACRLGKGFVSSEILKP